jgi:hypothetical protein
MHMCTYTYSIKRLTILNKTAITTGLVLIAALATLVSTTAITTQSTSAFKVTKTSFDDGYNRGVRGASCDSNFCHVMVMILHVLLVILPYSVMAIHKGIVMEGDLQEAVTVDQDKGQMAQGRAMVEILKTVQF